MQTSVADLEWFDADLDSTFYVDADLDLDQNFTYIQ